ncbi:hypothetical protein H5181_20210 [Shewanella sp. SG44-2]|uniref:hypothetical protein n=1 Tax=Shewanella sp. SG44-2 TaxID=2760962 RepID=UPI0015FFC120|nr:hypothetical protein [Shewanella sp. SG44-2]MBB1428753.1 hypothetical protein [Shewanella sp. SG44-2]
MNYSRVIKFSLLLFFSSIILSTLNSFVFGYSTINSMWVQYLTGSFWAFLVYIYLSIKQVERPYLHAILVTLLLLILDAIIGILMHVYIDLEFVLNIYIFSYFLAFLEVSIGTAVGIKIRKYRFKAEIKT